MFTFLLGPTQTYANTTQEVMECCMDASTEMSCCDNGDDTSQKEMPCKKNCESIGCTSPITCCHTILLSEDDNTLNFVSFRQRQQHFYAEVLISSDFRSIWLPPKIA